MIDKKEKQKHFSEVIRKAVEEMEGSEYVIRIPLREENDDESDQSYNGRTV